MTGLLKMRHVVGMVAMMTLASAAMAQVPLTGPAPKLASEQQSSAPVEMPKPAPTPEKTSFLHLLTMGGWAMIPLAACSLVGLALAIERGMALRRSQILPSGFMAGLDKAYQGRDTGKAVEYCRSRPSAIGRIMAAGLRKWREGTKEAEQAIADQGATEVARLRRNLRLLHGIAAITPTLGLLGTVWGMIRAFEAASRVGLGHSEELTKGIYEALVATMAGLMIAVPVLVCYYVFLGIIDRAVLELNDTCQGFLDRHATVRENTRQPVAVGEE
jgi:biopolymer transport protein ExbB